MGNIFIPWLADAARLTGYPVVEVAGWQNRGASGGEGMDRVEGVVGHHTAGPRTGEYPSYNVVLNGRRGLSGPLAHLGIGRSGTIYVFGAGKANHAGVSDWLGLSNLNDDFIGIEAEDDGDGNWTSEQLDVYPRLVAALLHYMRRGVDRYASHRSVANPPGRKPDPTGIDDDWMRQVAQGYLNDMSKITRGNVVVTGPVLGAPVRNYNVYGVGDRGSAVEDIQNKLIRHGFSVGSYGADGIFGNATRRAVLAFQQSRGISVDGLVGPETMGKLNENSGATAPAPAPTPSAPAFPLPSGYYFGPRSGPRASVSGYYSHRNNLRQWQQRMKDRGWTLDVDGLYGPRTAEVARKFQAEKGLSVDGLIGVNTWNAAWTAPVT